MPKKSQNTSRFGFDSAYNWIGKTVSSLSIIALVFTVAIRPSFNTLQGFFVSIIENYISVRVFLFDILTLVSDFLIIFGTELHYIAIYILVSIPIAFVVQWANQNMIPGERIGFYCLAILFSPFYLLIFYFGLGDDAISYIIHDTEYVYKKGTLAFYFSMFFVLLFLISGLLSTNTSLIQRAAKMLVPIGLFVLSATPVFALVTLSRIGIPQDVLVLQAIIATSLFHALKSKTVIERGAISFFWPLEFLFSWLLDGGEKSLVAEEITAWGKNIFHILLACSAFFLLMAAENLIARISQG